MKIKDLIERLKTFNQDEEIRFYYLENNNLQGCELETIIFADEQVEITIQNENEV